MRGILYFLWKAKFVRCSIIYTYHSKASTGSFPGERKLKSRVMRDEISGAKVRKVEIFREQSNYFFKGSG